jgi:hypothetical protein
MCQNPNHMPGRFDSARFESTKSHENERTCSKMHYTIGGSSVFTQPRPERACRERRLSGKPVWSPNAPSVGSYCAIAISAGTASLSCSKTLLRRSVKSWACFGMFPRSTHLVRLTSCLADERPLSRGSEQILDWPACATGARKVSAGRSRPAPEGTARGGYAAINDLQYARAQAARRVRRCSTRSARGCRR